MQNSESVTTNASSPIQGSEVFHGDGEKALSLSAQLKIKSGGDDAVAPKGDEVDRKPTLVGVSHKRKASTETGPLCESDPNSSKDSKRLKSPSVSTLNVEQQQEVDEELRPQEGRDVESEKVKGDKGVSDGGLVEMDSDQKGEGLTVNSPNDNVEEEKVETEAMESMNVLPEGDDKGMPHGGVPELELDSDLITGEGIVISHNNVEEEKVEIDDAVESMNVEPEGDKGTSHGGRFKLDLNRRVDEIVDSPSNVETEIKVESDTIDLENMDCEPQGNNEMPGVVRLLEIDLNLEADQEMVLHSPSDAERETTRVEPEVGDKGMPHEGLSLLDLNKGVEEMVEHDDSVDQNIKVEPYTAEENTEVNCAIDKLVQIGSELFCELNKEADFFFYENEVEAEPAAANAEEKKKKTEVESSGADKKVEVEQCAEENTEEDDDDDLAEVEKSEVVLAFPAIAENLEEEDDDDVALPAIVENEKEEDDDDVVEAEKREVVHALPDIVENDEVEASPPPRNFVIDLNKPPPGYNNDGN